MFSLALVSSVPSLSPPPLPSPHLPVSHFLLPLHPSRSQVLLLRAEFQLGSTRLLLLPSPPLHSPPSPTTSPELVLQHLTWVPQKQASLCKQQDLHACLEQTLHTSHTVLNPLENVVLEEQSGKRTSPFQCCWY